MSDLLELLEKLFEGQIPSILLWVLLGLLLLAAFLRAIPFLARELIPIFYSREKARKRNRRQRFAEHMEHEQRRLNSMEEWSDHRFTELEAEVEAEGTRRRRLLPFLVKRDNLRREPSLSKALENSQERLILLEGMPGSGKSVALRHVALTMSRRAMRSRSLKTVIPVYVNLKALKRRLELEAVEAIDAELIRRFVLQSLNRANDRDVTAFLDDEFQVGLSDGTWLFLFDSFDEIPEILGSTEADTVIVQYAEAIHDFLHGMNRCRGIIASREYRGPSYLAWPRFRIMPLASRQQQELVKRSGLPAEDETKVLGGLLSSPQSARHFIENPMFLGLLCAYVQAHHGYPEHESAVYEAYIASRLARDQERLRQRFDGLSITDIREGAENIAFCMLTDSRLGLSATWQDIAESLSNQGLLPSVDVNRILDALHYTKLGKLESDFASGSQQVFTFIHRRLQEHLATTLLLREPERVSPSELLTNGVWRESAVVMLQTQSAKSLEPLLSAGIEIITRLAAELLADNGASKSKQNSNSNSPPQLPRPFPWPAGLYHVLELLHNGLVRRPELVPEALRKLYSDVVTLVWDPSRWLLADMQAAISISGLLPQHLLGDILAEGLEHRSRRTRDIAYRQLAMLRTLNPTHARGIRRSLVEMARSGRLWRERKAVTAYLLRLDRSEHLLDVVRFISMAPYLGLVMGAIFTWLYVTTFLGETPLGFRLSLFCLIALPLPIASIFEYRIPTRLLAPLLLASFVTGFVLLVAQFDLVIGITLWVIGFMCGVLPAYFAQRSAYILAEHGEFMRPREWPLALVVTPLRFVSNVLQIALVLSRNAITRLIDFTHSLFTSRRSIRPLFVLTAWSIGILAMIGAVQWVF